MHQVAILISHNGELSGQTVAQIEENLASNLDLIDNIQVMLNGVVVFDLYGENEHTRNSDAFSAFSALCSALPSASVVEHVFLAGESIENIVMQKPTPQEMQLILQRISAANAFFNAYDFTDIKVTGGSSWQFSGRHFFRTVHYEKSSSLRGSKHEDCVFTVSFKPKSPDVDSYAFHKGLPS